MDRFLVVFSFITIIVCCSWFINCAQDTETPAKLLKSALEDYIDGQEKEKNSYAEAYALYRKTMIKLEQIISRYPDSSEAKNLLDGKTKIGDYMFNDFKHNFFQLARKRSKYEENPGSCAFLIIRTMRDTSFKDTTLKEIAQKFADTQQFIKAMIVADTIENRFLKAMSLSEISREYFEKGNNKKASEIIENILGEELAFITDPYGKTKVLTSIAGTYLLMDNKTRARKMLDATLVHADNITPRYSKATMLGELAVTYAKIGEESKSRNLMNRAKKVAGKIKNMSIRAKVLADLGKMVHLLNKPDQAKKFFGYALKKAKKVKDPSSKIATLNIIAEKFVEIKSNDNARKIVSESLKLSRSLGKQPDRDKNLASIAGIYAKIGEFKEAKEIMENITDARWKTKALSEISSAFLESNQRGPGLNAAALAYRETRNIKEKVLKDLALFEISGKFIHGFAYKKAYQIARTIGSNTLKFIAFSNIAKECMNPGPVKPGTVQDVIHKIIIEVENKQDFNWDRIG